MSHFEIHDLDSAPAESKLLLERSIQNFGSIPNLHGVMAESPVVLEAYQQLHTLFQNSSFDAEELTVIWQTINVEHNCHYCVPAHAAIAQMMKVDDQLTEALRERQPMPKEKLQVLHDTTLALVRERGILSAEQLDRFYNAGYNQKQLLEIVLGIAQKVMSNYINHLADTPLDERFAGFA
ncbi:carboxymuconolactone decarboxylase family protein [Marinobacterium arenosum]|uniref:carboxymuconolactone decarboxylase family protein n=1 Tax=Marinobacterium arenosum TaxID=2862496 RepID=UPI001C967166|nr:carboxymuconolactone decarboxylase family protein [Marinobacterium arenosum]MBY4678481.1 carboxymuconolactone decarboxylase family protein [Marinobacterium arenosum]